MKEKQTYRGVTWSSGRSLSLALGKYANAFCHWKKNHPGKTERDYIDFCLDKKN